MDCLEPPRFGKLAQLLPFLAAYQDYQVLLTNENICQVIDHPEEFTPQVVPQRLANCPEVVFGPKLLQDLVVWATKLLDQVRGTTGGKRMGLVDEFPIQLEPLGKRKRKRKEEEAPAPSTNQPKAPTGQEGLPIARRSGSATRAHGSLG